MRASFAVNNAHLCHIDCRNLKKKGFSSLGRASELHAFMGFALCSELQLSAFVSSAANSCWANDISLHEVLPEGGQLIWQ